MNSEYVQEKTIMHTNKVFIGDICYALDEEIYYDWANNHNGEKGLIKKDNKVCAIVGGTYDGDGCYKGSHNSKDYCVDAGVIGVIDLNYHNKTDEKVLNDLGEIVEIPDEYVEVDFLDNEGYFVITLKDKNGKVFYYNEIPTEPVYYENEYLENNDEWNNWNNYEDEDDYPEYEDA